MHVYLTGSICVEGRGSLLVEEDLPGTQGRIVLSMLAAQHDEPVARDQLAEELWMGPPPPSWETAIRVMVSKVRRALSRVSDDPIKSVVGYYELTLGEGGFVDLEALTSAVHHAESALAVGDTERALGESRTAMIIASRQFLPGVDGPWTQARRFRILDERLRALEVAAEAWLRKRNPQQAANDARIALDLDPCRESIHRLLIRSYSLQGDRGRALQAFDRCRQILLDELGVHPSPETLAVHRSIIVDE